MSLGTVPFLRWAIFSSRHCIYEAQGMISHQNAFEIAYFFL
jgi:hypothetical protein